jgi:tRNA-specific 2-thiouridylase
MPHQGRVIVGLSGGVDSAVAALRLQEQGWAVSGLFMKNWEEDDEPDYCAAAEDLKDAQAVADRLDIELFTVNFSTEYWDRVFEHFLSEYRVGRTPNPDVLCNSEIKFHAFLDYALARGADYIATGHYARVCRQTANCRLLLAEDEDKDQTYFLHRLNQHQLCHSLFPLGDLLKAQVRHIAAQVGFANHAKKDSTGICFIGERRFRDFLSRYIPAQPGPIENLEGEEIGRHHGLMYYTIGQRQGLGIGGLHGASEGPWFVAAKDLQRNALLAVQGHDHPLLLHRRLDASQLSWIACAPPDELPYPCQARIRHRHPMQTCRITALNEDRCEIEFDRPQRAITPGQSVVLYRDAECLGGGVIERGFD